MTADRRDIDPVTLAVVQSGLSQVCNEMDLAFVRAAFSPVISEALDRSDGIYHRDDGALTPALPDQLFAAPAGTSGNFALGGHDPKTAQGWKQCERDGLASRRNADALLALALVHHLAIGKNIPLSDVVD